MTTAVDEKAGYCGFCRTDEHGMCASAKCTCPNKGRRNHALRPRGGRPTTPTPIRPDVTPPPIAPAPPVQSSPKATPSRIVNLRIDGDRAALLVRALLFTVGEDNGGTSTECFEDDEHAEMLRLAESIGDVE